MIPHFPIFKNLEFSDKADIELISHSFHPYSDFNYFSMCSWNTQDYMRISMLNGNLVVRFTDYITNNGFYSFLGKEKAEETAQTLLEFSRCEDLEQILKLLPESVANRLDSEKFEIKEDIDAFDYVYEIEKLSTYDGNKLRSKRNLVNRFNRNHKAETRVINSVTEDIHNSILTLFDKWIENKNFTKEETMNERTAFIRVLQAAEKSHLIFFGLFIEGALSGIIINELLPGDYSMLHFEKADEKFIGIYAYIMQENCKMLLQHGKRFLNYEQDLGIPGLRLGKKSFYPCNYLKKYIVKLKHSSTGDKPL